MTCRHSPAGRRATILRVKRGLGIDPGESDGDRAAAKEALRPRDGMAWSAVARLSIDHPDFLPRRRHGCWW